MITLDHVSKVYGSKRKKAQQFQALNDISLAIEDGSSVAIIGKSGSGKSTLMHVMSGLDSATGGEIEIDGQKLSKMTKKQRDVFRAKTIGFIFQSFFVQGNDTCYDNVALPLEIAKLPISKRAARVKSALSAVQLDDKIKSKAKNLSGGQKQRLAIARAIVNKPKILFADEPTGNLDTTTGKVIEKLLFSYNKKLGATLIVVTHDEDLAAKCDVQIRIKDGMVTRIDNAASASDKKRKTV